MSFSLFCFQGRRSVIFRRAHAIALVLVGLLVCTGLLAAGASRDSAGGIGRACSFDGHCRGYYRCITWVCAVPPAVLGQSDGNTPTVELITDGLSRGRFFVELARDELQQTHGLSHRPSMAGGWGMLFVFPQNVHHAFTMALMRFPLDIVFFDARGMVVDIIESAQPRTQALIPSQDYKYVLELNAGVVRAHGIQVGDSMKLAGVTEH